MCAIPINRKECFHWSSINIKILGSNLSVIVWGRSLYEAEDNPCMILGEVYSVIYPKVQMKADDTLKWMRDIAKYLRQEDGYSCEIYVAFSIMNFSGCENIEDKYHLDNCCKEEVENIRDLLIDKYVLAVLTVQSNPEVRNEVVSGLHELRFLKGCTIYKRRRKRIDTKYNARWRGRIGRKNHLYLKAMLKIEEDCENDWGRKKESETKTFKTKIVQWDDGSDSKHTTRDTAKKKVQGCNDGCWKSLISEDADTGNTLREESIPLEGSSSFGTAEEEREGNVVVNVKGKKAVTYKEYHVSLYTLIEELCKKEERYGFSLVLRVSCAKSFKYSIFI